MKDLWALDRFFASESDTDHAMGIYDRDYARHQGRRGGSAGAGMPMALRGLSIVHWLIIINIAVFALDALVPPSSWPIVHMGDRFVEDYDPSAHEWLRPPKPDKLPQGTIGIEIPIVDRDTGAVVGRRSYQAMPPLQAIGHFSTAKGFFGLEVWRFITFQFLHANLTHLLFNMIGLWVFGPLVEQMLRSPRRFLAFYLICGIAGALLYLFLNLLGWASGIQAYGLLVHSPYTPLIGASAGVFGVLLACAHIAGEATVLVMLLIPMRLRTLAYLLFFAALANLLIFRGNNAGGDAAHIGGALAGAFFIRKPELLHEFFDVLKKSTPSPKRGAPSRRGADRRGGGSVSEKKLDDILRKVSEKGLHSLSDAEKKLLNRASKDRREP